MRMVSPARQARTMSENRTREPVAGGELWGTQGVASVRLRSFGVGRLIYVFWIRARCSHQACAATFEPEFTSISTVYHSARRWIFCAVVSVPMLESWKLPTPNTDVPFLIIHRIHIAQPPSSNLSKRTQTERQLYDESFHATFFHR